MLKGPHTSSSEWGTFPGSCPSCYSSPDGRALCTWKQVEHPLYLCYFPGSLPRFWTCHPSFEASDLQPACTLKSCKIRLGSRKGSIWGSKHLEITQLILRWHCRKPGAFVLLKEICRSRLPTGYKMRGFPTRQSSALRKWYSTGFAFTFQFRSHWVLVIGRTSATCWTQSASGGKVCWGEDWEIELCAASTWFTLHSPVHNDSIHKTETVVGLALPKRHSSEACSCA